ncbi:MAG: thiamine phosphate synthase [Candidatus Geothermincolia bacterium]
MLDEVRRARRPDWAELMAVMVITANESDLGRRHEDVASAALHAGCRAIQFRDKEMSDRAFIEEARVIQVKCLEAGALFFVNDRVHVAAALDCEVHLGFKDMSVEMARKVMGSAAIIGYSPENLAEAREAVGAGADYLGAGPVFGTFTKADAGPAIGLDGLARICEENVVPVIAVGGIDEGSAGAVAAAGAMGIAVVSAVSRADDMKAATAGLLEAFAEGASTVRNT